MKLLQVTNNIPTLLAFINLHFKGSEVRDKNEIEI